MKQLPIAYWKINKTQYDAESIAFHSKLFHSDTEYFCLMNTCHIGTIDIHRFRMHWARIRFQLCISKSGVTQQQLMELY